jgi:hypothetical protein
MATSICIGIVIQASIYNLIIHVIPSIL